MKSKFLRHIACTGAAVIVLASLGTLPANATEDSPQGIQFGYFETDNFAAVYESIVESNDPGTAAEYFRSAANDPDVAKLPGTENLTIAEKKQVLTLSAEAAAEGEVLPVDKFAPKVADSLRSISSEAASISTNRDYKAVAALDGASDSPIIAPFSYASAPIAGQAINNRFSWQMENRFNWSECPFLQPCKIVSWVNMKFTTNPGKNNTGTSLQFLRWGTKLGSVQLNSTVFAATSNYGPSGWKNWSTPGTGTQWNYHNSTLNKSFQVWYEMKIATPGGTKSAEWKTGKSGACKEPSPGAYRCLF